MGAIYIKGRVAKITEEENGNLVLHYEDIENGGKLVQAEYDSGRAGRRRAAEPRC